ncbi:MAG TPA: poly(R)-hydroxyalkanoic acid synthase subunit PhaE [Steroidobacteraceae bacterium]
MPDAGDSLPWMPAWVEVQRKLLDQAAKAPGGDYVGIAADWWRLFGTQASSAATATLPADLESLRTLFIDRYRQLFTPEIALDPAAQDPMQSGAAVMMRWQAATRRIGQQIAAIANDAFRRLSAALATNDAALPPITSLRELHELWIECGEAAYAAAAHGDEFADAQAELLSAWVELRADQRPRRP